MKRSRARSASPSSIRNYLEQTLNPANPEIEAMVEDAYARFEASPATQEPLVCTLAVSLLHQGSVTAAAHGIRLLERLCAKDVVPAMYNLAVEKQRGVLVPKDFHGANQLLAKVDALGYHDPKLLALAHSSIGTAAMQGWGRPVDLDLALAWFDKASRYGIPDAAYNAGLICHGKLDSRRPNFPRAAHYYQIGADAGHTFARTNLGLLNAMETFPGADPARGILMLRRSIQEGDAVAVSTLKTVLEVRASYGGRL